MINTFSPLLGNEEDVKRKSEIANELLITTSYRSEFFFKHAIKVPYLSDIDWEVVFKLSEKNVEAVPGNAYGLLALTLHDPFIAVKRTNARHITVAVDENLVNKLLATLNEVKARLEKARQLAELINKQPLLEEENNESANPKQLE